MNAGTLVGAYVCTHEYACEDVRSCACTFAHVRARAHASGRREQMDERGGSTVITTRWVLCLERPPPC